MGIWLDTPGISVGLYIWKGIAKRMTNGQAKIPAGLGNIIGGAIFCGGYYYGMYLFQEDPVIVDGEAYEPIQGIHANGGFHWRGKKDLEGGDAVTREMQTGS
ncbi:MAG: hypothetical protein Q9227_007446 [Pyrenula ochraceoflavens]